MPTGGPISDSAENRLRAREDFLKLMSHEIRTPLNGVLGMLGLLSRTALDSEQQAYVRNARDCGDHLLTLVNALLDYAKIEAGKLELEDGPVDLEALLQGVCELLSPRAHEKNIELIQALGTGPARILGDEGRLRQILFNLAGNAVKFTDTGGVAILAETDGDRIRFSLRDTGPGIAEDARERIFEEFGHADAADASRHGGAGLGLAVVRRLVEAMDGELGLDSVPGDGSTFWFSLPLRPAPAETGAPPALDNTPVQILCPNRVLRDGAARQILASGGQVRDHADPTPQDPAPQTVLLADRSAFDGPTPRPEGYGGALILLRPEDRDEIPGWRAAGWDGYLIKPLRRSSLVARIRACLTVLPVPDPTLRSAAPISVLDDDDRIATATAPGARVLLVEDNPVNALLVQSLLKREGCQCERVSSGQEALDSLAESRFDLVLMDVRMPVMDGQTATRLLRARGDMTPVVALTANAYEEDRRACLSAGMNDFLTKPLEPALLRAALARWTLRPDAVKMAPD